MYWKITVLHDMFVEYMEMRAKYANSQSVKQIYAKEYKIRPTHQINLGLNHRRNTPVLASNPPHEGGGKVGWPSSARSHLPLVVQSMHMEVSLGCYHV